MKTKAHAEHELRLQERMAEVGGDRARAGLDVRQERGANDVWSDCPGCARCEATGGYVLRRGSWRHTRAHEFVFQLVKSMGYFANQEAVREDTADYERKGGTATWECGGSTTHGVGSTTLHQMSTSGRNPRTVWTPSPESYSGAHYAVYPTSLIAPLIRASVPTRCCPVCGAAWAPVIQKPDMSQRPTRSNGSKTEGTESIHLSNGWFGYPKSAGQAYQAWRDDNPDVVLGYRPTCDHDAEPIAGWCLDQFVGSGTTLKVCAEQGVNGIGIDLSAVYLDEHAKPRGCGLTPSTALDQLPLFAGVTA